MKNVRTPQPLRRYYFAACVAMTALFFLIPAAVAAQSVAAQSHDSAPAHATGFQATKVDPALMAEFNQLMKKLQQNFQIPPLRTQSRLLPLLPEETVFYAAFPNYGEATHQALGTFQQELKDSPVLRAWWQRGDMATEGPKVEDAIEKIYQLSQYLGDEVVLSATTANRKEPGLLLLAEVRKPGLKDLLLQMTKELSGKSTATVRIFDPQDLAKAKDTVTSNDLVILVRPDFVVAATDVAALRSFSTRLDRKDQDFASTPFGQRLTEAYASGTSGVGGVDLQAVVKQFLPGLTDPASSKAGSMTAQNVKLFQRSGFADVKYLIWQQKFVEGHAASQMELSFTGPRHGIASWLAAPGPLGSLDFVSPRAVMASAVLLKNPAEIFDDIKDLMIASNPNALVGIAQMERGLKVDLREDLFSRLTGEIGFEVDNFAQPEPVWKVILRVHDPEGLQTTLTKLLATAPVAAQQVEDEGITYHILRTPSAQKSSEFAYAFVDGYLVMASSRLKIAEAIRLHRSGESLAKSQKFLASVPQGNLSELSALLYEDPLSMAMLSLRQAAPEMAEAFSQAAAEKTPVVVSAYGEESSIREASQSAGFDTGGVLVVAAIALPNLLRARTAANESSAVATIRTANVAQVTYSTMNPQRGFAHDFASLGPDPRGPGSSSPDHASVIDATLGNASCTAGAWCEKSGFHFSINTACGKQRCSEYVVVGTPVSGSTGTRSFCSTSDGVVRFKSGPPLTTPVSASECRLWPPLQ
jgi:type II secretory pathway pseudopilin PulG